MPKKYQPLVLADLLKLTALPYILFVVNYVLGTLFLELYRASHIDIPMHFLGGLAIAYSANHFLSILDRYECLRIAKRVKKKPLILCTVLIAAVVWELYECISDYYFQTGMQQNSMDTIKDIGMGLLGGYYFCRSRFLK